MSHTTANARFTADPLATASEQWPLARPSYQVPGDGGRPSPPGTRPFGLRSLRTLSAPAAPDWRYCPERQLTVRADGSAFPDVVSKLDWTTVTHADGDEGPAKDYNWETIPDFTEPRP